MKKYKFVYFNTNYSSNGIYDINDYNAICVRDLLNLEDVQIVQLPLQHFPRFFRRIYNVLSYLRKITKINFIKVLYPFIFKSKFNKDDNYCFIVSSYNLPIDYYSYLKKHYKNCKLIKIYRDLVDVIEKANKEYSIDNVKKCFDFVMSYDKGESEKYNLIYFDEIESKINIDIDNQYSKVDLFIAAKAKNRLSRIMKVYDAFTSAGYTCNFYLTGVSSNERICKEGIIYADVNLTYIEMLKRSISAKCMLDINQIGADGYTSRFLEAVMYNKPLICDNQAIKESKFYNPKMIYVIDDFDNIDTTFLERIGNVSYGYNNEFSPLNLINQIKETLNKEYEGN